MCIRDSCEDSAAHDWSADGLAAGENPFGGTGAFSVRWHGSFAFRAGQYRFKTASDDGSRLYVDGERAVRIWLLHLYMGARSDKRVKRRFWN